MAKLLVKFTGQPEAIYKEQLFDNQKHFDQWLAIPGIAACLPNAKIDGKTLTFDGGSATIETKPDDFFNDVKKEDPKK